MGDGYSHYKDLIRNQHLIVNIPQIKNLINSKENKVLARNNIRSN